MSKAIEQLKTSCAVAALCTLGFVFIMIALVLVAQVAAWINE